MRKTMWLSALLAAAPAGLTPAHADSEKYYAYARLTDNQPGNPAYYDVAENSTGASVQSFPVYPGGGIFAPVGAVSSSAGPADNGSLKVFTDVYQTGWIADAQANLQDTFEIQSVPGATATVIPLHIIAGASSTRNGTVFANGGLNVSDGAAFAVFQNLANGGQNGFQIGSEPDTHRLGTGNYGLFSVDRWITFAPDTPITVSMSAVSQLFNGVADVTDEVTVDPVFEIDPAYASQFRLVGLPAGASPAAVPEPTSWLLMIVGFGMIGHVLRSIARSRTLPTPGARFRAEDARWRCPDKANQFRANHPSCEWRSTDA